MGSNLAVKHVNIFEKTERPEYEDHEEQKKCCRCKLLKLVTEFSKRRRARDGLSSWCKDCDRACKEQVQNRPKTEVTTKQCSKCHKIQLAGEFTKNNGNYDGLSSRCRECVKADRQAQIKRDKTIPAEKQCCQCGFVKSYRDFDKKPEASDGLHSCCKKCRNLNARVLYLMRQVDKKSPQKAFAGIDSWEQVEDVLRHMAELQIAINQERADCDWRIDTIKRQVAKTIKPIIVHQTRLHLMLESFLKKVRRTAGTIYEQFDFGSVRLCHGKLRVELNIAQTAKRLGKA